MEHQAVSKREDLLDSQGDGGDRIHRRSFVRRGSLILFGAGASLSGASLMLADEPKPKLRIGLITDMHYADKPAAGTRHYRETLGKLEEAGVQFQKENPSIVVELGDFVDAADSIDVEKRYLKKVHKLFSTLPGKKHYVLGNHCVHSLTKEEFLGGVGQEKSYYSFDADGFHFVVLDACYRADGEPYGRKNFTWTDANIPPAEIEWLQADLKETSLKTIVFAHQRLDVSTNHSVKNAATIRKVLEDSKKVVAVFQGHSHQNSHQEIGGIHYCVLAAMIEGAGEENNGYSTLDLFDGGIVQVNGFRRQSGYRWP